MSQPKLPLKVRYTRGKFRHLASPLFWFPLGIISLLVVFIWQISINPELLQTEIDQLPTEGSDVEEKEMSEAELNAIAADIDSSEFLLKELETNTPPANLPVIPRKAVLDDYIDENGKSLTLLEKTQQELSDIYGQMGKEKTTENLLGENFGNNSILNWRTNQEINPYSPQGSNNRFSNPQPLFSPNFNSLNSEKGDENSQNKPANLQGLMQNYLDPGYSSESGENNYRNSNNYDSQLYQNQEDLRRDNSQLPNSPNYSNPEIRVNSGYLPYDNSRQQEQPYYTNSYGSSTVETPENQPYYSDRYGNYSSPTQPTELNVPSIVPIVPNNRNLPNYLPYSRTGYPYSGNNPYSVNQGYPQYQQNQPNNGANYYQQNNGATQQPQPYNSNPFNNQRFGEQNNPFSNNR
jgi:hypothetical protein